MEDEDQPQREPPDPPATTAAPDVDAMEALGLEGVPPMIAFDPRWHD